MKKSTIFYFLILSILINGCEDLTSPKPMVASQPPPPKQEKAKKTIQKLVISYQKPKKVVIKSEPIIIEEKNEIVLDLSFSFDNQQQSFSDTPPHFNHKNVLPDLFIRKHQKSTVQIDGDFIAQDDQYLEKQEVIDGIGININLIP